MQHVLGIILHDNKAEVIDDITPGGTSYSFMGLHAAIQEGEKRIMGNPNIKQINVYEVFDGVKRISATGRLQLVHQLLTTPT